MDTDAGWETIPIPPDYERVPSTGVAAGYPDADRQKLPIPPDCKHVPGSGITADVADAGWETISTAPDYTRIPDAGVAAGAPGPDQETMSIPSDCERVLGNGGDAGDPFVVRFYVDDSILVGARFFQDGRRLRRMIAEIAYYGSHPNSESHTEAICAKFVQDVVNGRAVAFKRPSVSDTRGLCVSPVGAVEGRKLHIIHDLTFAGNGYRSSVNGDTDFSVAPPCELGHVFADVCRRVLYLRQRLGVVDGVMLYRIDVKDAFARFPACC